MTILKIVIFIIIFIISAISFTLFINQANLLEAPGFSKRLTVFLTKNIAVTADDHEFKELSTPVYQIDADQLFKHVLLAASELGWNIVSHDSDSLNVSLIVRTRLFLFEDDVFVHVSALDNNKSSLYIKSKSRKGKADFSANSGHIQTLIKKINKVVSDNEKYGNHNHL